MLNGNKSKSERRRTMYDPTVRATSKTVVAGKNKRGDRKVANQTLRKEMSW